MFAKMFCVTHWTFQLICLVNFLTSILAQKDCTSAEVIRFHEKNFSPFFYCSKSANTGKNSIPTDYDYSNDDVCLNRESRVKLDDVQIYYPKKKNKADCGIINKLNYLSPVNWRCITSLDITSLVKPFLETFSYSKSNRKSVEQRLNIVQSQEPFAIYYKFSCVEDKNTIDMCRQETSYFEETDKLKLLFKKDSLGNSTSCFCFLTSSDSQSPIKMQALDIRLNPNNKLSFNSEELKGETLYWWQNGDLIKDFSKISLVGVDVQHLPDRIWMMVSGKNISITCDTKPIEIPGDGTDSSFSSGSGGFGIVLIICVIMGVVVLLIILFAVMRCLKQRKRKPDEDEMDDEMDEYRVARPMSAEPSKKSEEEILLTSTEIEYSLPNKRPTGRKEKLSEKPQDYTEVDIEHDESKLINNNHSSVTSDVPESSLKDIVYSESNEYKASNVYAHLGDKPDIVPSPSSDIYDATGESEYSSLQRRPKTVTTDNIYDVA